MDTNTSISMTNGLLLMLPEGALLKRVLKAAAASQVQVCQAQCDTDFIAVPHFLAIADPRLISREGWSDLCEFYRQIKDPDTKLLLTAPSPHMGKLCPLNQLKPPAKMDEQSLKFLFLRLRATVARRRAVHDRTIRQITRLMFMLHKLEMEPPLRVADVARELETTRRTVQRDLQVLTAAGYIIDECPEPGAYRFPPGYHGYSNFDICPWAWPLSEPVPDEVAAP